MKCKSQLINEVYDNFNKKKHHCMFQIFLSIDIKGYRLKYSDLLVNDFIKDKLIFQI